MVPPLLGLLSGVLSTSSASLLLSLIMITIWLWCSKFIISSCLCFSSFSSLSSLKEDNSFYEEGSYFFEMVHFNLPRCFFFHLWLRNLRVTESVNHHLIFDVFRGHAMKNVTHFLEEKDCFALNAPHNKTNYFQMFDLNVNGHAKEFLKKKFEEWYAADVKRQLGKGKNIYDVWLSMKLSNKKRRHTQ